MHLSVGDVILVNLITCMFTKATFPRCVTFIFKRVLTIMVLLPYEIKAANYKLFMIRQDVPI